MKSKVPSVVVQVAKKTGTASISPLRAKRLTETICKHLSLSKTTISIALVNDKQMRQLNKRFRNHNCSTDCLSFDLSDRAASRRKLFELIINAEKAIKEAARRGHCCEAELALYITHSILHNLGFDDAGPKQAKKMHITEDKILQRLGFGSVYNALPAENIG
jgi:probable rRNA maturation factor